MKRTILSFFSIKVHPLSQGTFEAQDYGIYWNGRKKKGSY
jgi:hypothetical protein